MKKIFCDKCKYLRTSYGMRCAHPDNMEIVTNTGYLTEYSLNGYKVEPWIKNENNNCSSFIKGNIFRVMWNKM